MTTTGCIVVEYSLIKKETKAARSVLDRRTYRNHTNWVSYMILCMLRKKATFYQISEMALMFEAQANSRYIPIWSRFKLSVWLKKQIIFSAQFIT